MSVTSRRAVAIGRRVLVLCHANRFRSPLAAGLLEHIDRNNKLNITSAGFSKSKQRAGSSVRGVAKRWGVDLEDHRSTAVTLQMLREADDIVFMGPGNRKRLEAILSAPVAGQRWLPLGRYASPAVTAIPDLAWLRGDPFDDAVELLHDAVHLLYGMEYRNL